MVKERTVALMSMSVMLILVTKMPIVSTLTVATFVLVAPDILERDMYVSILMSVMPLLLVGVDVIALLSIFHLTIVTKMLIVSISTVLSIAHVTKVMSVMDSLVLTLTSVPLMLTTVTTKQPVPIPMAHSLASV